MFIFLTKDEIINIFETFKKASPDPKTELEYTNDYTLLVAVILSAQATDKSVNKATKALFTIVKTPQDMIQLGEQNLIPYIKSIGLYRAKAKHIIEMSNQLISSFNGKIPSSKDELLKLSGVGEKTANVILNVLYNQDVMPVDTHIMRLSQRIGFSDKKNPLKIEEDLVKKIPTEYMNHAHHWLILHGRYVCKAKKPDCINCIIKEYCKHNFCNLFGRN